MNTGEMRRIVRSLMKSNQVESRGYRYTRPAPSIYEHQWLWDSCFHAIIYRHIDPEMAKDELRSLLHPLGVETDGMVPHMIYWRGGGNELWGREYTSTITQPPMIAYAALMVYSATGDRAFLHEIYEPMYRYYDWLLKERDYDRDCLITIIHPWESGWDASPRWDSLLGLSDPTEDDARQARFGLALKLKGRGHDMSMVIAEDLFHVEPVDYNAIYSANVQALARIAAIIGRRDHEAYFTTIAHKVNAAIRAQMWDEQAGLYWDLAGIDEKPIKIPTPAPFVTLLAGIPSRAQVERLIDRMLSTSSFLVNYPIPTVSVDHPTFSPDHYWRGNTWMNVNWFIVYGLRQYGFTKIAQTIVRQSIALIEREGFREYYDPFTGQGLGSRSHSWSGLVLDMVESRFPLGFSPQ